MSVIRFDVSPAEGGWQVDSNGTLAGPYLTREAAFEALLGPASNALKQGDELRITIEAPPPQPEPG